MGLPGTPEAKIFRDAVTAFERGDFANAERQCRFFLAIEEKHFGALNLLTLALMRMGRWAEAESAIARAVRLNKRDEGAWSSYALILISLGRPDEALDKFDRAIKLNANNFRTWNNRGALLRDMGRYERAAKDFDKAIAANGQYFVAYYNKAGVLAALERYPEALEVYDALLTLRPDFADGWVGRGLVLAALGRGEDALACHDKAISLKADFAEAHFNRANALVELRRAEAALASYDRAIALKPDYAEAHFNRGNALRDLRRFNEALPSYEKAIALRPDYAEAYNNRGNALVELNRLGESLAEFDKAIALRPDYGDAHYNKSVPLLLLGEFEAGWRAYEWRKAKAEVLRDRGYKAPMWAGEDISGKTILVHWEQGFGDTIQICRYVKLLERAGARVLFAPQRPLRALMRSLGGAVEIVDADDNSLEFDFHCPQMSLPLAFKTTLQTIPADAPYLSAEPERVARWAARIGTAGFKIGIGWLGSPFGTKIGRSAPLAAFARLAKTPGVRLISLQKLEASDPPVDLPEGMALEFPGEDFDAGPDAFLDAAAVMKVVDLAITVDTAIAHVGGALGVPTWVAQKFAPDWRWLMDCADSPWYPTVRLFRQKTPGDWAGVFCDIEAALAEAVAKAR